MTTQLQNFLDNTPPTELSVAITTDPAAGTVETWSVVSSAGWPPAPFEFGIDLATTAELCLCESVTGNSWAVQRGYDGTTPVTHSIVANQIQLVTSSIVFQEANDHIAADPDDHLEYLRADGVRHDLTSLHGVGTTIDVINPYAVPPSHWGDPMYLGTSPNPASAGHVHGRETIEELAQGIIPAGTIAFTDAEGEIPPGWLACTGLDVRTDLAPEYYAQVGFVFGTAIDWYPPAPDFPTFIGYQQQTLTDQTAHTTVVADVPYAYMWDPRKAVMYLPPDSHLYAKTPNLPYFTLPGIAETLQWVIKVDYGYTYTPRPKPPAAQPLYIEPYGVDTTYPKAVAENSTTTKITSSTTYKVGSYKTSFTWGYDTVMGIPVIMGTGYIGPGESITGPFLIPVYPYGAPLPSGTMLFPDQTLAEDVSEAIAHPVTVKVVKITPIPQPKPKPKPKPKAAAPKPKSGPPTYIVKKGDNLWDIAHRFKIVPWTNIEVWNPQLYAVSHDWNLIYPGQLVYLGPHTGEPAGTKVYEVRSGDNLYDIAKKFGISLAEIESLNPDIPSLTGSWNLIYPGMNVYV